MTIQEERNQAVAAFIQQAQAQVGNTLNRETLDAVLQSLVSLASSKPEFWSAEHFPAPEEGELQARYMIHEEPDHTFALYLNVMKPGKKIAPHDHTTWACIAGVEGNESNFLYERTDDGTQEGHAVLRETGQVNVGPGTGIALMPDDIHAVRILDESGIRHLHMYGLALEKLDRRTAFDLDNNTCRIMSIGVQTRR